MIDKVRKKEDQQRTKSKKMKELSFRQEILCSALLGPELERSDNVGIPISLHTGGKGIGQTGLVNEIGLPHIIWGKPH